MNSLFNKYKWLKYVLGSFIIVIGIIIIILACLEPGLLDKVVNIVLPFCKIMSNIKGDKYQRLFFKLKHKRRININEMIR